MLDKTINNAPVNHFDTFYEDVNNNFFHIDQTVVPRTNSKLQVVFGNYNWLPSYAYEKQKQHFTLSSNKNRRNLRSGTEYFLQ